MLWFHLFTEIKQQRNNLFLWSPIAFAFGIAATFAHGHWIGPALFILLLIFVLGYLGYYGLKDSAILPLLMYLFVATLGAGAASLRSRIRHNNYCLLVGGNSTQCLRASA